MPPTIAELAASMPDDRDDERSARADLDALLASLAHRSVPTGRLSRLFTLGGLQAQLAGAYLAWWLRSIASGDAERRRRLDETHLKAALKVLGGMGYLRGAIMKVGQVLAAWPEVLPDTFADLLGRLHFDAPPMHFALVGEVVRKELGDEPQRIFDGFQTRAFAAASLGQVHRARLREDGRPVAVKIQYPGIARAIRSDVANLKAAALPMRLSSDWDNVMDQLDDIRDMLEEETDYGREADHARLARVTLAGDEEFLVPEIHERYSTSRVLTMDLLEGQHLGAFLASNPSQDDRDRRGSQIVRASLRLSYTAHLLYADPSPGNYLFLPDGRLGLIDFGCCRRYDSADVEYLEQVERAMGGSEAQIRTALARGADLNATRQRDEAHMRLLQAYAEWIWQPLRHDGPFDFGDGAYFRRGAELYAEVIRRRCIRSLPLNTWLGRNFFGVRAMLTRLAARVDMRSIMAQETTVTA